MTKTILLVLGLTLISGAAQAEIVYFEEPSDSSDNDRIYYDPETYNYTPQDTVYYQVATDSEVREENGVQVGSQTVDTYSQNPGGDNRTHLNTSTSYYFNSHEEAVEYCGAQESSGQTSICQASGGSFATNSAGQFQINVSH